MQEIGALALRMDDPGASSKEFAIYGKSHIRVLGQRIPVPTQVTNFWLLKLLPFWRGWGPYRELRWTEWRSIIELLQRYDAKMTVAITACWVEGDGKMIPFCDKFPKEAEFIREGHDVGVLEIANHGLTHCVVGKHLPRLLSSNQRFHREFWDWLPSEMHFEHLTKGQEILQKYFDTRIVTFVPPGNQFCDLTVQAARRSGITTINCRTTPRKSNGLRIIGNQQVIAFHDRDVVLNGIDWFEKLLRQHVRRRLCFVKELPQDD